MSDSVKDSTQSNGRWTKEEHNKFLLGTTNTNIGLQMFGKNWKKI